MARKQQAQAGLYPGVWVIMVDTRHFDFIATGSTPDECANTLAAGWQKHCEQTGAEFDYLTLEDYVPWLLVAGECYRDQSPILGRQAGKGRKS